MVKKPAKKRASASKNTSVVITMLVDESGSMIAHKEPTMAGYNEYVDSLKTDLADIKTYFSAIKFDTTGIRKLQVGVPIAEACHLTDANYSPCSGTPLYDAIGQAIEATDGVMKEHNGHRAIVVIQTDGEENSSKKYALSAIKVMIESRQAQNWQFVFLGAGIDAFRGGVSIGINPANTMSYSTDARSTRATFAATAVNTQAYASGLAQNMFYNSTQSAAAGEAAHVTKKKLADARNPVGRTE